MRLPPRARMPVAWPATPPGSNPAGRVAAPFPALGDTAPGDAASRLLDHGLPLQRGQPGVFEVLADLVPAFGQPHHALLFELGAFMPGDGLFAAPVVLELRRDLLARRLAQRGVSDDAHEVVERGTVFRPQRRGVVPPPLRAVTQCHQRDRNAPDRRFKLFDVMVMSMPAGMRAQPCLLDRQPHGQRGIPVFGGGGRIAKPALQRPLQLPALACRQRLGVQVLRRGGFLEPSRVPIR